MSCNLIMPVSCSAINKKENGTISNGTRESMYSCKMAPKWNHCQKIVRKWNHGVKSCFSSQKYTFAVPNRLNMLIPRSPVNFKRIREGHILPYHVTWSHRLKIAIFKTYSESLNMGRVCSVLMPVVTLQSFKVIGRLEVG